MAFLLQTSRPLSALLLSGLLLLQQVFVQAQVPAALSVSGPEINRTRCRQRTGLRY